MCRRQATQRETHAYRSSPSTRVERAVGEDDAAAGLHQRRGCRQHPALQRRQLVDVGRRFRPRHVGMPAHRAGRGAGRIEQDRVEEFRRFVGQEIGLHEVAPQAAAGRDSGQAGSAGCSDVSIAVTCAPASTSCAVLPPGAAHRSATRLPAMSPEQARRQAAAASCTHHSPSAKPGRSETCAASFSTRTEPVGSTMPPSRSAQRPASALTVKSTGASTRWAARIAAVLSSP